MVIPTEFDSSGSKIKGYFFPSAGKPGLATVLFLQGFPGVEGDELLCERLAQEEVSVLTFNYRGTFCSEGWFSFSHALEDIGAAIQYLRQPSSPIAQQVHCAEIVLGGWSFGSGLLATAAVQHPEIRRIFAISGRDFSKEATRIEQDSGYAWEVMQNLQAVRMPHGPVTFMDDILSDLVENRASFEIEKMVPLLKERDILLIGGWNDQVSAIEEYLIPFYRLLKENGATKVRIEALADEHEFSETKDQLVRIIIDWIRSQVFSGLEDFGRPGKELDDRKRIA